MHDVTSNAADYPESVADVSVQALGAPREASDPAADTAAPRWLRLTFAKLEVPVTVDDAGARIGNADFYRARTFAGQRMPVFLNCGDGITGANALSIRMYMSLLTTIVSDGRGGSKVAVVLVASARDVAGGASTDRVPCGSTGVLEKQRLETIRGYLPAG